MVHPENRVLKKLNGFLLKVEKNHHLHALELGLNDAEYRLWRLLIASEGYDQNNSHYGNVKASQAEIGVIIGWSNTKVCRYLRTLSKKGLIKGYGRNCIYVSVKLEKSGADQCDNISPAQQDIATLQQNISPAQESRDCDADSSLVSFNGNLMSTRSKEEYDEIERGGAFKTMTVGDMRWLDTSYGGEEKKTAEDSWEDNFCQAFFGGDYQLFERSIVQA